MNSVNCLDMFTTVKMFVLCGFIYFQYFYTLSLIFTSPNFNTFRSFICAFLDLKVLYIREMAITAEINKLLNILTNLYTYFVSWTGTVMNKVANNDSWKLVNGLLAQCLSAHRVRRFKSPG